MAVCTPAASQANSSGDRSALTTTTMGGFPAISMREARK
jgi:hypothetical protein